MQVDPINPKLKPPGSKLLKLKCGVLLSNFAFKSNSRRYMTAEERAAREQLVMDGVIRSKRYTPKALALKAASLAETAGAGAGAGAVAVAIAGASSEAADPAAAATRDAVAAALDPLDATDSLLPTDNANGAYDRECTICRYILHLSGVACVCNPGRPACLRHSAELCDCPNSNRVMFYRKSIAQLERLVSTTERACGRGLHSFTSQLNLSAFCALGGAPRGCVARDKGLLGGV